MKIVKQCKKKEKIYKTLLPYSAGILEFNKPKEWAFFIISHGYFPVLSYSAATGIISSLVNFLASSCTSFWVSLSAKCTNVKKVKKTKQNQRKIPSILPTIFFEVKTNYFHSKWKIIFILNYPSNIYKSYLKKLTKTISICRWRQITFLCSGKQP